MPQHKISTAELVHRVIREAAEPLSLDEIMQRVMAIAPITTKNPRSTISNAANDSAAIAKLPDARYGWRARVINGSVLRLPIGDALESYFLLYPGEVRDALHPTYMASKKYQDESPAVVRMPDGKTLIFALSSIGSGPGVVAKGELREWLLREKVTADDDLILTVVDAEARQYSVALQRAAARDEDAIEQRNAELETAIDKLADARSNRLPIWGVASVLLANGFYRRPVPPDPIDEVVDFDAFGMLGDDPLSLLAGLGLSGLGLPGLSLPQITVPELEQSVDDPTLSIELPLEALDTLIAAGHLPAGKPDVPPGSRLFLLLAPGENIVEADPPGLHPSYTRGTRMPVASSAASAGTAQTFVFRISHQEVPKAWRDIEIVADQTLEDLHLAIQQAFGWDDDHLYSFYTSGRPFDTRSEIGAPWSDAQCKTYETTIDSLKLKPGKSILYIFDYGDDHRFDVTLQRTGSSTPGVEYPHIVASRGRAPEQYADDW